MTVVNTGVAIKAHQEIDSETDYKKYFYKLCNRNFNLVFIITNILYFM